MFGRNVAHTPGGSDHNERDRRGGGQSDTERATRLQGLPGYDALL
jgi:hypothetical protein